MATRRNNRQAATTPVMVYGSLMSGLHNHRLLCDGGVQFVGDAVATANYRMRDLRGFPGAYADAGGEPMPGELYEVDARTLAALDRLEGNGRFYRRELMTVEVDGDRRRAWVYLLMAPGRYADRPLVAGNDWRTLCNAAYGVSR